MRAWRRRIQVEEARRGQRLTNERRRFNARLRGGGGDNNSNGFTTSCWGPALWHYWHIISRNYILDRKQGYIEFLKGLLGTLPCKACRDNLPQRLLDVGYNIDEHSKNDCYTSRGTYTRFVFAVHDAVNTALGKPKTFTSNYKERVAYYDQFRAKTCSAIEEVACRGPLNVRLTIGGGADPDPAVIDLTGDSDEDDSTTGPHTDLTGDLTYSTTGPHPAADSATEDEYYREYYSEFQLQLQWMETIDEEVLVAWLRRTNLLIRQEEEYNESVNNLLFLLQDKINLYETTYYFEGEEEGNMTKRLYFQEEFAEDFDPRGEGESHISIKRLYLEQYMKLVKEMKLVNDGQLEEYDNVVFEYPFTEEEDIEEEEHRSKLELMIRLNQRQFYLKKLQKHTFDFRPLIEFLKGLHIEEKQLYIMDDGGIPSRSDYLIVSIINRETSFAPGVYDVSLDNGNDNASAQAKIIVSGEGHIVGIWVHTPGKGYTAHDTVSAVLGEGEELKIHLYRIMRLRLSTGRNINIDYVYAILDHMIKNKKKPATAGAAGSSRKRPRHESDDETPGVA